MPALEPGAEVECPQHYRQPVREGLLGAACHATVLYSKSGSQALQRAAALRFVAVTRLRPPSLLR